MTTKITAETLTQISHNNIPVITTELLSKLYGTNSHSITKNHRSNVDRFVAGKHYFKIAGDELSNLQITFSDLQISPKTRSLILWTERGAARHAKMLETDQAWEVFERLEDCYFNTIKTRADELAIKKRASAIDDRTSPNNLSLLTNSNYRQQARDYLDTVLSDCFNYAKNNNINTSDWDFVDKEKAISGLLAELLHSVRAEISFDKNLRPTFKLLPSDAIYVIPSDIECMKAVVSRSVPINVLVDMINEGVKRLAADRIINKK